MVYSLSKSKGEIVGLQSAIAIIGDAKHFILEMQVDEYDIIKIKKDQLVYIAIKAKCLKQKFQKLTPL